MVDIETPSPILDRVDHVGGIESITLDGKRYFFGFDFGSDLVVSPLISNTDAMAQFASQYMLQRDGKHDSAYWLEYQVQESIKYSELGSGDGERDFSRTQLQSTTKLLDDAIKGISVTSELMIPYHLRFLFGAASGWNHSPVDDRLASALQRLKLDPGELFDAVDAAIAFINEPADLPRGASRADAAIVLQNYLRLMGKNMPANWSEVFSMLVSPNSI